MIPLSPYQKRIRHFWLYVLQLEAGKYYVGITARSPEKRIRQHGGRNGARWTMKYKPVAVLELHDLGRLPNFQAEAIEHQVFEDCSQRYGLRNVRGGRLVTTQPAFKVGALYFTWAMVEGLVIAIIALLCIIFLLWQRAQ